MSASLWEESGEVFEKEIEMRHVVSKAMEVKERCIVGATQRQFWIGLREVAPDFKKTILLP